MENANKLVKKNVDQIMTLSADKTTAASKSIFGDKQLARLFQRTPQQFVGQLSKGGTTFNYVSGGYVRRELDILFGFDWDFEIISTERVEDDLVVIGKLTARGENGTVVKMQAGGAKIKYKKQYKPSDPKVMLDYGNDVKAAATDALKKCAAELGIARDIYYANEFMEAHIVEAEAVEEAKTDAENEEAQENIRDLTDQEKGDIIGDLAGLNVKDRMRIIKAVTNKVTLPSDPDDRTLRQLRGAIKTFKEEQ